MLIENMVRQMFDVEPKYEKAKCQYSLFYIGLKMFETFSHVLCFDGNYGQWNVGYEPETGSMRETERLNVIADALVHISARTLSI